MSKILYFSELRKSNTSKKLIKDIAHVDYDNIELPLSKLSTVHGILDIDKSFAKRVEFIKLWNNDSDHNVSFATAAYKSYLDMYSCSSKINKAIHNKYKRCLKVFYNTDAIHRFVKMNDYFWQYKPQYRDILCF